MFKRLSLSLFALGLTAGAGGLQAQTATKADVRLPQLVENEPALAEDYKRVMSPLAESSSWVLQFGTTAPAAVEAIDGKEYYAFWGCKPHECTTESYVLLVDQDTHKISAGAFLHNEYDGQTLTSSEITWLGETSFDLARAMGKYLY